MSIHFISGKPGGGKTLYSVRLIIDEIVRGSRPIVTNVPLNIPRLNEFIQCAYPAAFARRFCGVGCQHISEIITVLDEDNLNKFFTYRGNGVRLESIGNAEWKAGKRPDYSLVKDSGVFYVLDEVHIAFNSRAWAETGAEVLYYLSQHRKLGDDVVCITQAIANVDKQFRSVAQDFTYIKNLSKQRAGFFRLPAYFTRNTYAQPATDTSKPMESGSFSMDVSGIASCYDTAKGVGIHGRSGGDTNERKKGLHWLWFLIGAPLLLWGLLHYLPVFFGAITEPKKTRVPVPEQKVTMKAAAFLPPTFRMVEPRPVSAAEKIPPVAVLTNELFCVGFSILAGKPTVYLSDGQVLDSDSPELEVVKEKFVVVRGKKIPVKLNPAIPPAPPYVYSPPAPVDYSGESQTAATGILITPPIGSREIPQTPRLNGFSSMGGGGMSMGSGFPR